MGRRWQGQNCKSCLFLVNTGVLVETITYKRIILTTWVVDGRNGTVRVHNIVAKDLSAGQIFVGVEISKSELAFVCIHLNLQFSCTSFT